MLKNPYPRNARTGDRYNYLPIVLEDSIGGIPLDVVRDARHTLANMICDAAAQNQKLAPGEEPDKKIGVWVSLYDMLSVFVGRMEG